MLPQLSCYPPHHPLAFIVVRQGGYGLTKPLLQVYFFPSQVVCNKHAIVLRLRVYSIANVFVDTNPCIVAEAFAKTILDCLVVNCALC